MTLAMGETPRRLSKLPPITFVMDEWPLAITYVRDGYTLEDFEALHRQHEAMLARKERFVAITDIRGLSQMPTSAIRQLAARWKQAHTDEIRLYNAAAAIVVDSLIARAALRAIQWVAPHPTPYAICATPEEARAFCFAHLSASPTA